MHYAEPCLFRPYLSSLKHFNIFRRSLILGVCAESESVIPVHYITILHMKLKSDVDVLRTAHLEKVCRCFMLISTTCFRNTLEVTCILKYSAQISVVL
jgi:hypothetical protein